MNGLQWLTKGTPGWSIDNWLVVAGKKFVSDSECTYTSSTGIYMHSVNNMTLSRTDFLLSNTMKQHEGPILRLLPLVHLWWLREHIHMDPRGTLAAASKLHQPLHHPVTSPSDIIFFCTCSGDETVKRQQGVEDRRGT